MSSDSVSQGGEHGAGAVEWPYLPLEVPTDLIVQEPQFYDFSIVLDSGAAGHVVDGSEAPGYKVIAREGSKVEGCFVAAHGQLMPHKRSLMSCSQDLQKCLRSFRWLRSPGHYGASERYAMPDARRYLS